MRSLKSPVPKLDLKKPNKERAVSNDFTQKLQKSLANQLLIQQLGFNNARNTERAMNEVKKMNSGSDHDNIESISTV